MQNNIWWLAPLFAIITILSSVGGAFAVLKVEDAVSKTKSESLEMQVISVRDAVEQQRQSNSVLNTELGRLRLSTDITEKSITNLNNTMKDIQITMNSISVILGRVDERLKNVERR